MLRGNLPRCHLMAISWRVGLFWPIIEANGVLNGIFNFKITPMQSDVN